MRVEMPDGTILEDVPDNATRSEILKKFKAKGLDLEKMQYSPTLGMSGTNRFFSGVGKAQTDIATGVRQYLPSFMGGKTGEDVREKRELDKPLSQTSGGQAGEIVGNMSLAMPLAMAPGANTMLGAGLYGAGFGAAQPAETSLERIKNIGISGGLSAGITGGANKAIGLLGGVYKGVISPFTKRGQEGIALDTIKRFAHDKDALSKVHGSGELVPGSAPTLAELTGDPGIAQLQRAATAASPETANLMASNKTARMQARKDALTKISGDHDSRMFLEAERASTADSLYKQAYEKGVDITRNPETGTFFSKAEIAGRKGEITKLLQRPAIQEAMKDAKRLAANEGIKMDNFAGSVQGLDYVKRSLDGKIQAAVGKQEFNEARILGDLRDRMLTTIDKLSPDYAAARKVYADMSKPINRADVGKYLYEKLIPSLTDLGAERITPAQYAKALADGDEMAKNATGFKGAKLNDVLSSEDLTLLINLGLDLGREAGATAKGMVPGSQTAQYLTGGNAMRQIMGPMGMPQSWSEGLLAKTLAGRAISSIVAPVEHRVQSQLGRFLVNPQEAKLAEEAMKQRQIKSLPLSKIKDQLIAPTAIGTGGINAGKE